MESFPLLPALSLGGAAAGASLSASQAQAQNDYIRRQQDAQRQAARIQLKQLDQRAELERMQLERAAEQVEGRINVMQGASGSTGSQAFDSMLTSLDADTALNLGVLDANLKSQRRLVQTGAQANLDALESNLTSPLLATIIGGFGGGTTGLQIGGALDSFGELLGTPQPEPFDPSIRVRLGSTQDTL